MSAQGTQTGHAHHFPTEIVADRRGLTAVGGASIAVGLGLLGAIIDVVTGAGLRTTFAVLFIIGCIISALLVHTEDLLAAVIMPPLVYLASTFVGAAIDQSNVGGGWFRQKSVEAFSDLVFQAPVLITATVLSVAIALARRYRIKAG